MKTRKKKSMARIKLRTNKELWEICMKIYRAQYRAAEPSVSLNKLIKSKETLKPDWYSRYHLSINKQIAIFRRIVKRHQIKEGTPDYKKINNEMWLGASPCSCEYQNRKHKKYKPVQEEHRRVKPVFFESEQKLHLLQRRREELQAGWGEEYGD